MAALILIVFLCVGLLACAGEKKASTAAGDGPATGRRPAPDLATADFRDLIYWDNFFEAGNLPGSHLTGLVDAIIASGDDRYAAILVDLAFYGTAYGDAALEHLLGRKGPFSIRDSVLAVEERGFRRPEDDLPAYLAFKRRLLATIVPEFAGFLDPSLPRTISAQEVFWGGVAVDGIPPLNDPRFISPEQASRWILPNDFVIGVEINGDARAYPRRIIDWHEMVNDIVGGVPVSLAYCTLCGSAILYDGRAGDRVVRFGTSGLLYRSNKLMYDTETRSLWEQYTGEPAWGPLVGSGIKLAVMPVVHTTWSEWLKAHPETTVLDIVTGFARDYGSGVAYASYWASPDLIFAAPNREGPLARKDYVYAVRIGTDLTAYPLSVLSRRTFIEDQIADRNVIIIATADGNGGRAYELGDNDFSAVDLAAGTLTSHDGQTWRIGEEALVSSDGRRLARLPGHNSFWFAITNHAPSWRLYEE